MIKEFYENVKKSNTIGTNSSEILTLNIEDLLSFAHLKSKTFFKNTFDFNISSTVNEVVKIQQHQSDSRKLSVSTHFFDFPHKDNSMSLEENLDFKQVNMMVRTDKLRVKQVLMNLFSNAIKFTKERGNVKIICQYVKGKDPSK